MSSSESLSHRTDHDARLTLQRAARQNLNRPPHAGPEVRILEAHNTNLSPDMTKQQEQPNLFVRCMRKIFHPLGFTKGYNFGLFAAFFLAMFIFCLVRSPYLNIGGSAKSSFASGAAPGEWYWYRSGIYRVGITMHLAAVIPAGILMVWQFLPVLRRGCVLFHRINGFIIYALITVGNIGGLLIARRTFGGATSVQAAVGLLAVITWISMSLAWYNIRRLQIEQHRAWMLRMAFYLGTIITTRLIVPIAAVFVSRGVYHTVWSCDELSFYYTDDPSQLTINYPACNITDYVAIQATFMTGRAENIGAALQINFGMALWVAIFIHTIGVEIYLNLTPREAERLRVISHQRQLAAGFKNPGSAGLTVDRWGDADPWMPPFEEKSPEKTSSS
ncbi:hypothetical protein PROFUN_02041 [Planoprotostelium fungivorum]|uniref:DUF2306 domain-containing protein n=1 Tax=Planoprotostelium fungivorum TaxID=1890364 RepID=A0A2P6NB89_9EUKA|nr:hypothetical protein PROFUN_02041 [Planoprotostelium fungivorum]